jgi:hypothetical protein
MSRSAGPTQCPVPDNKCLVLDKRSVRLGTKLPVAACSWIEPTARTGSHGIGGVLNSVRHIACGNQMFGSYETLVSATAAAVKIARVDLMNLPTRVVVERTDGDRETVWDLPEPEVNRF